MLFEQAASVQHVASGLDIRITIIKSRELEWPRLIFSKNRQRNIHYDVTMIKDEEKRKKFLELPKECDESDSDNSQVDMMYNVCSDLDSDFDNDLNEDTD